ncbi:DUF481 domain-containing protein [Rubrivivax gelatinosus]|uniref:Salt-induced outer membrane protein n=1 Tax=Rubrivivax gelatinosus (strain NBRC 100245 / IL144) TaxID=983917 RepID=I0HNJ8_RUBGI|nr:DUF481 domain-containing protein [Rubrivivax gelatinosus]MBG6081190.1 putative salt-induced outer membrane protein [Rubrivivax gelatinosus]BAL94585.1 hypothetical protein RGE_12440 [Rubrivivax gelatinosus IL144]
MNLRRSPSPCRRALRAALPSWLFAASAVQAQWLVPPPQLPVTDGLWRGSGGAAATITSGNTDGVAVSLNVDAVRATPEDRITLGGSLNYGRSEAPGGEVSTTADRWNASGRYDLNLTPRRFVYGRAAVERDRVIALDRRDTVDAGLGWKLVDRADANVSVFAGLGRSVDRYSREQTIDGRRASRFTRSSLTLGEESVHRLTPTVELRQRLDVAPTVSGDRTTIVRFSTTLAVAFNSTLGLTVTLADRFNSEPPDGVRRNDLTLFTGLNLKFGPQPPAPPPPPPPR